MSQCLKELVFVMISRLKRSSSEERAGYVVVFIMLLSTLFFAAWLSYDLSKGQASAAAQWGVATGTSFLATFTFLTLIFSSQDRKEETEKQLTLRRLEGFYSPILKILSGNPEAVKEDLEEVRHRASELVSTLKGKRYLARIETINAIPVDIEEVAFGNWMKGAMGYLVFKDEEQMDRWSNFAKQVWKDYDFLVKKYYNDQEKQDSEPEWFFKLKEPVNNLIGQSNIGSDMLGHKK